MDKGHNVGGIAASSMKESSSSAPPTATPTESSDGTQSEAPMSSYDTSSAVSKHKPSQESWDEWEEEEGQGGGDDGSCCSTPLPQIREERIHFYQNEIKGYILDIADPSILEEIDKRLHSKTYQSMAEYYLSKPKLATYTIESEVSRMKYKVMYDGAVLAETPDDVRRTYQEYQDSMIWRFANQSIFADCLQELQLRFIRAELDIGVVSRDSQFVLNVADDSMIATSQFHVMIAAGAAMDNIGAIEPSQAQHTNGAVELATVMGTVELCISDERLIQSVKLTGLKVVFDEVIRHVAESLALNEAREGRGSPVGESLIRAPLGALRDQVFAAAGGRLRAVGQASKGLFQGSLQAVQLGREAVSNIGAGLGTKIEEATALEDGQYATADDVDGHNDDDEWSKKDVAAGNTSSDGIVESQNATSSTQDGSDDSTKAAAAAAATRVRPNRRPSGAGRRSSSKNEGPASSSFLNHPHLNTPAVVAQAVVHQSEGLMEGIVGGIGALVGAGSGADGVRRSSSSFSTPSSSSHHQGAFKLYRKDDDDDPPEEPKKKEDTNQKDMGGLFDRMMMSHPQGQGGRGIILSHDIDKGGIDKNVIDKKGPLPAPPSTLLKCFFGGITGYIASSVERVINDDHEYEDAAGQRRRRDDDDDDEAPLQLYRREEK